MKNLIDIVRFLSWGNWGLRALAFTIALFVWALVRLGILG